MLILIYFIYKYKFKSLYMHDLFELRWPLAHLFCFFFSLWIWWLWVHLLTGRCLGGEEENAQPFKQPSKAIHGKGLIIRATLQLKNNFQSLSCQDNSWKQVLLTENRGFMQDKSNYLLIPIFLSHFYQPDSAESDLLMGPIHVL